MYLQTALEQLRPNHLPPPVGIWPIAPGWWTLAAIGLTVFILAIHFTLRHRRKHLYRRKALAYVNRIVSAYESHGNKRLYAHECNRLLKKVALQAYPRQNIASLNGSNWLNFLSTSSGNAQFTAPEGAALGTDRFKPDQELNVDQLRALIISWIKHHHA